MKYSFGVPSVAIWSVHILTGLYFLWLGYQLLNVPRLSAHALVLIVLGAVMILYHFHLWYYYTKKQAKN